MNKHDAAFICYGNGLTVDIRQEYDPVSEQQERTYHDLFIAAKDLYGDKVPDQFHQFIRFMDAAVDRQSEHDVDTPARMDWLQNLDENLGDA